MAVTIIYSCMYSLLLSSVYLRTDYTLLILLDGEIGQIQLLTYAFFADDVVVICSQEDGGPEMAALGEFM